MKILFCLLLALCTVASAPAKTTKDSTFVTRIETCEAILQDFAPSIPPEVLQRARAFVIVNQIKAGALFGFQQGYATLLVKKPSGQWSVPVLVRAGGASLGLQLGGSSVQSVYVIMNDETPRQLFTGRFAVGVDAKAVAGPRVAAKESWNKELLLTPVLVYSQQKGLYAGATVKTGYIERNDSINRDYYDAPYDLPELLYGDLVPPPPEVQPLMAYVTQLTASH